MQQKFIPSAEYIDHYFIEPSNRCETDPANNFESYGYELLSKQVPPLSLPNIYDGQEFPLPEEMTTYLDQFSINNVEVQKRSNVFMGDTSLNISSGPPIGPIDPFEPPVYGPYIYETYNSYIKLRLDTSVPLLDQATTYSLFKETGLTNKLFSFSKEQQEQRLDFYADSQNTMTELSVKSLTSFLQDYDLIFFQEQDDEKFYRDFPEPSTFEAQFLRLEMLSRVRDHISSD